MLRQKNIRLILDQAIHKPNRLKKLLAGQTIAVGAQLRFGSPAIAELFGLAGFDWILIDGEHAPQSPMGIQAQLHAIGCTDATPIVRVRTNDPELFRVYLDMGAGGIVAPFVNTAEQARCGAASCLNAGMSLPEAGKAADERG